VKARAPISLERDHATGDVHDRVHGADVVKWTWSRVVPVSAPLGVGQPA